MSKSSTASVSGSDSAGVEVVPGSDGALAGGGGGCGAGGFCGSPASAGVASIPSSASASINLFTVGLPPFSGADERDSIVPDGDYTESLFAQFWTLHLARDYYKALAVCDHLLEVIDPSDCRSHVRQANARAMELRELCRFSESKAVHLAARPFLPHVGPKVAGDYFHGLGCSHKGLGEYVRAFKALDRALRLYRGAGFDEQADRAAVNIARLYVVAGRPVQALALLDKMEPCADSEIARAMAFEKEGDKSNARRAITRALALLADSSNEATRAEALEVFDRIERRAL